MTIGYIISDDPRPIGQWFEVVPYTDYNESKHKPCLFIGIERLSEFLNQKVDVVNRRLSDDRLYTFTKYEYRKYYEDDLYEFKKRCYESLVNDISYYFVDPLLLSEEKYAVMMKRCLDRKTNMTIMTYGDMYYASVDKTILGFNKNFQGFVPTIDSDLDTLIAEAKRIFSGEDLILQYSEHLDMLGGEIKFLPYICSLNEN
jgi:hypothetical protein